MAAAFVSAVSTAMASTTSHDIDLPANISAGDLLLMAVCTANNGFQTYTAPVGWTVMDGGTPPRDGNTGGRAWYRKADGTEGSSLTISTSGNQAGSATVARYTGADGTTPVNTFANPPAIQNATTISSNTITPSVDGCLLVGIFIGRSSPLPTWTEPSGYDERDDDGSGVCSIELVDKTQATAATSGPITATPSVQCRGTGWHLAIAPAEGGGGGGVSTTVGAVSAAATVTAIGRSFAHVVGVSSAIASVAGVGANANAGERETVGTSTGQASVVGVGQSEVFTVGNSAGSASVVGVGEAVQPPGQAVGTSAGIATVLGVASSIAEAVGTSSGSSDASGVNPQVVVTQRLAVGAGGELSWEDHVKTIHEMRMLEGQVRRQRKELQKVVKQIKSVEKKFKAEKTEGILANLHRLEQKKDELENKIEALEVDLEPLTMAIEKFEMREIEEDDQEFMSLM